MPPAPRPISSRTRQSAPHSRPPAAADHPPSSLDLLFSYSRSAAFYGENLPHAPSFVQAYRRPGDATDEDGSDAAITTEGTDQEGDVEGDTTTDDLPEEDGEGDQGGQAWSEDDEGNLAQPPWASLDDGAVQLPRNARVSRPAAPATRRESGAPKAQPAPEWTGSTPTSNTETGETTPLLAPIGGSGTRARRPSTFTKEVWKARIEEHRGESSWGQTLFNTINVLIGVGLLADPLAMADSGWAMGVAILLFCSFTTFYTAVLLSRLMRLHPSSHTYADVLIRAYGPWTRSLIYFLFVLELSTFSVAAVELFADSISSLYPNVGLVAFKLVAFGILLPTTFLPLRLLSLTSLLGIFSSFVVLAVLIADGAIKPSAPGSLREVMPTSWTPRLGRFPLSFGLFMSGFSGHAVVPSLYRDMKKPRHFGSMAAVAFSVAFVVSLIFAVLGYLMFGNSVSAEITRDLASTPGYPIALNKLAVWMVAINPLVKYAIANKPLVQTFEHLIGLHNTPAPPPTTAVGVDEGGAGLPDDSAIASSTTFSRRSRSQSHSSFSRPRPPPPPAAKESAKIRHIRYFLLRPLLTALCVLLAVLIPEFDRVLAFLGSASAFVICVILPVGAYLISGRKGEVAAKEREGKENGAAGGGGGAGGGGYGTISPGVDSANSHSSPSQSTTPKALPPTFSSTTPNGSGYVTHHPHPHSSSSAFSPSNARAKIVEQARLVRSEELARRHLTRTRDEDGAAGGGGEEGLTISTKEKVLCYVVLVVSAVMATVGTVWSFLPVEEAGEGVLGVAGLAGLCGSGGSVGAGGGGGGMALLKAVSGLRG